MIETVPYYLHSPYTLANFQLGYFIMKLTGPERYNAKETRRLCALVHHCIDYSTKRVFREVAKDEHIEILKDDLYPLLSASIACETSLEELLTNACLLLESKPIFKNITSHDFAVFAKKTFMEADFLTDQSPQVALAWTIFQNQLKSIYDTLTIERELVKKTFIGDEAYFQAYICKKFLEFAGQLSLLGAQEHALAFYQFLNLGLACQHDSHDNGMDNSSLGIMFAPSLLHGLRLNGTFHKIDLVSEYKFMTLITKALISSATLSESEEGFISLLGEHKQPDFATLEKHFVKKHKHDLKKLKTQEPFKFAELRIQPPQQELSAMKDQFDIISEAQNSPKARKALRHVTFEKPALLFSQGEEDKLSLDLSRLSPFNEKAHENMEAQATRHGKKK